MPSVHPGMIKPSVVDVNEFELINAAPIDEVLEQFGLTIEQVLNKYPNVTHFNQKDWIEGSVGDVCNWPRHIEFIDSEGNGFTLLSRGVWEMCWFVSKINDFVKYNNSQMIKFEQ